MNPKAFLYVVHAEDTNRVKIRLIELYPANRKFETLIAVYSIGAVIRATYGGLLLDGIIQTLQGATGSTADA